MEGVASSIASVDRHIARIEYYLKRMRQNSVAHTGLVRLPSHGSALKGYHSSLRIGTTALSQPKSCVSPKKHHHTVKNIEMGLKPEFKSRTDDIKSETKWTPLCKNIEVLTQTHTKHLPKRAESAIVGKDMKQPNMGLRGKSDEYLSRQRRKQSTGFSETNVTSALFLGATTVLGDSPPLMNTTSALLHSGESSFDSLLSKASSASFSSFEYDPAGEFATRTLQWRRAAYGLLASHYEKAFGLLYMAELGEGHSSVTAADLLSVTNLDHRFPHFSTENTSGDARPSALRNDKLNSASASSTHDLIHAERSDRGGSWSHHSIFRREPQEDRSSLPNYSKHIPNKQNVGARTPPLGNRCYELLTETQHRDAVVGRTIESQEDEGVTNLLRWAGESAASATERSAYRLQEQRRYLQCQQLLNELQREECAIRGTIESQEDEGVTNLLRWAGESAASATERSAYRLQEQRRYLQCQQLLNELQREECAIRGTIESQEDEGVTNLLRWAGESAASATERSAYRLQEQRRYLQCQQLLNELQREECAIRDTIESQEDEGVTNLLRWAGESAASATERSAYRLQEQRRYLQCQQLLNELQREECAIRGTIESQEDEGVTNLLRWAGESAASAAERSAYRLQEQRRYLQCQQLLNELQREECAIRDTIESQEDEGVTNLLRRVIRSNTLRSGSMLSVDVAGICASSDDKIVLDSEQRANTVLTTVLHELSTTREPLEGAGKSLIGASDRSGCDISISTTTGAEAIHYSAALEHRVTTPLRVADVADQHELPAVEATYPTAEPTKGYVWTEDQSNQVVSSYSDMVSCVEEQCYISLFKLVQREARNRWHNERAEYYARNEMRWDELNCYRSLVQWPPSPSLCFEEYAGDVAGSGGGHCEIEANNAALFKDEARATELYTDASLLCKRPHRNEPALLMVKDVTEPLEDPVPAEYQANEQNTGSLVIFDEAEHPKQHEKAVVWSINITDGRCSTPPHLRDRPWAPLLMRKSAVQGSIANDSDFTGYNVKRRKKVRSTECAGMATHGAASASGEARFVTLSRSNPCGSLQVCQKARQQGNTAAPIGYAEIYRLHLRKQRAQSLRGAQHLQPCYSKVTVSFLESAEWRYQKMYVDNYLFPSLSPMRGAPRVRKCADGVCSEVERAASIWDLAGY